MARARNIKPGFFINEDLVELPFATRLLFIGLWTLADRAGRLDDRPKRIKMSIFPADAVDVDLALNELSQAGLIVRYNVENRALIQVVNFEKHQNPHMNEAASTIPAPESHSADTVPIVLVTDSLNDDSLKPESIVEETPQAAKPTRKKDPRLDHPAIKAVIAVSKITPHEAIRDEVIDVLGIEPDVGKLRNCFQVWIRKGYKPKNMAWISDWYAKGIPTHLLNGLKKPDPGKPLERSDCDQCASVRFIEEDGETVPCPTCKAEDYEWVKSRAA
jgi:hypothetical protein